MADSPAGALLSQASGIIAQAQVAIGVETSGVSTGLAKVTTEVEGAGAGWAKAFKLASLGIGAIVTVFAGLAVEGMKAADALDTSMARISSALGLTAAATAQLRAGIIDLSTKVPFSIGQLADSIQTLLKVGYSVGDALTIQAAAAKAATASGADLGEVTDTVTTAMKAWGFAAKDVNTVTDQLLTTVGNSRIAWSNMSLLIATAAPIAKAAGLSFSDLNAAIIAVGRSGIPARRAASGVLTLIRSLSAPSTAMRKEMELLGIQFDSNTLKQKGLLAVLQEFDAKSGDHVNVIEKNKKGQIDWAKSIAETTKVNDGALNAMKTLTGGAAGLLTAQILLANNAGDFKDGMTAIADSAGKTADAFNAVSEADIGMKITLIKNTLKAAALTLGTTLLPYVKEFVDWIANELPKAITGLNYVWTTYLQKPLGDAITAFSDLIGAVGQLFNIFGGSGTTATEGIGGAFKVLAGIMATILEDVTGVMNFVTFLISNPVGKAVGQILLAVTAFRVIQSGLSAGQSALTSKVSGFTNFLTGNSGDASSTALKEAADAQKTAADSLGGAGGDLKASAEALKGAATIGREAGVSGAVDAGALAEQLAAVTDKSKSDMEAVTTDMATSATSEVKAAGEQGAAADSEAATAKLNADTAKVNADAAGRNAIAPEIGGAAGVAAAEDTGLMASGRGAISGAVGKIGGIVSKVFWPLLAVQIGTDIIKAPVGDFVSKNWPNAGAEMKNDFFGGFVDLLKSAGDGSDTWVGLAAQSNFGKDVSASTEQLSALGASRDQLTALQSGDTSLTGVGATSDAAHSVSDLLTSQLASGSADYAQRVIALATAQGIDVSALERDLPTTGGLFGIGANTGSVSAAAGDLRDVVSKLAATYTSGADDAFRTALSSAISGLTGLSSAQSMDVFNGLTQQQRDDLTGYFTAEAKGALPPQDLALIVDQAIAGLNLPPVVPPTSLKPVKPKRITPSRDESYRAQVAAGGAKTQAIAGTDLEYTSQINANRANMAATQAALDATNAATDKQFGPYARKGAQVFMDAFDLEINKAASAPTRTKGQQATAAALRNKAIADINAKLPASLRVHTWAEVLGLQSANAGLVDQKDKDALKVYATNIAAELKKLSPSVAAALAPLSVLTNPTTAGLVWPTGPNGQPAADMVPLRPSSYQGAGSAPGNAGRAPGGGATTAPFYRDDGPPAAQLFAGKEADDKAAVTNALVAAVSGGVSALLVNPVLKLIFANGGAQIIYWLASGVGSPAAATSLDTALKKTLATFGGSHSIPASPIKAGPLKHPFLPNVGRKIIEQISDGMTSASLGMAGFDMSTLGTAGPGGRGGAPIQIGALTIHQPSDELSVGNMLRFLDPGGL